MSARYQFFDDLPASWYERLKASIAAVGVLQPIVLDENEAVLDGHHRRRACAELHIDCPTTVMEGLSEDEKEAYVITTNALRRQLSGLEKTKAIQRLSLLGWSSRRIAAEIGVHHSTAARVAKATPDSAPKAGESSDSPEPAPSVPATDAPADPEQGDGVPAAPPARRVTGRDGKSHPATKTKRTPQFERTDDDDFSARFFKEMEHAYKTFLGMTPARVVATTPLLKHKNLVDFARTLNEWAVDLQTAASTKPSLKAVSDAS